MSNQQTPDQIDVPRLIAEHQEALELVNVLLARCSSLRVEVNMLQRAIQQPHPDKEAGVSRTD